MRSIASTIVPVALASIVCGIALAGGDKGDKMSMMDADGDGKVTATEHATGARNMFVKLDTDQNGRVTAAEMDAAHPMKGKADKADKGKGEQMSSAQKIAAIDTDGDGELTAAEHAAGAQRMFTKMDANHDGTLTAQEMREGHRANMTASESE